MSEAPLTFPVPEAIARMPILELSPKAPTGPRITPEDIQALTRNELRTLLALFAHADGRTRKSFPGRDRLATICGCAPRTITRHTDKFAAKGWIRKWYHRRRAYYLVPRVDMGQDTGANVPLTSSQGDKEGA